MIEKLYYKLPRKCIHQQDNELDFIKSTNYYSWYYTYGFIFKPKSYLEIGVRLGYSTIAVGMGARNLEEIFLYDNNCGEFKLRHAVKNIKMNLPNASILPFVADTQKLTALPWKVDMVHVDGEHTQKGAYNDLKLVAPTLKENGIIIVDDTKWIHIADGVKDFLKENNTYKILEVVDSLRGHILLRRM